MRRQLALIISLGFLALVSAQGNSPTYNFEMFLENSIKNYTTWLRANNLDPSKPSDTETLLLNNTVVLLNIFCTIREDQLVGHANQTNNLTVVAEVDMDRQFFTLRLQNQGVIQFQGKYSTNVTSSWYPSFSGTGTWNYTSQDGLFENATYRYGINENGHVEISEDRREYNVSLSNPSPVELDGILKEELDRSDLNSVKDRFAREYERIKIKQINPDHPTANLLHRYLSDIFQKTEYTDIIMVEKLIPTEPSSSTTTFTPRFTTSSTPNPQDNLASSPHSTGYILSIICATFLIMTSMTN